MATLYGIWFNLHLIRLLPVQAMIERHQAQDVFFLLVQQIIGSPFVSALMAVICG